MKNSTNSLKLGILVCLLLTYFNAFSQDFNVQHIQNDVGRTGGINTGITPVSSLNNAFVLANNNRKTHAGQSGTSTTFNGDDMAGARQLTATNTLTYYREGASANVNMRFSSSIWEYTGPVGGPNEMIIRGRYAVNLNGSNNSDTVSLSGITNANDCIPFITGIMNNATSQDADSATAIAYLENASTLRVQKGSNANNVTVYITIVEFTGANWTVLHGDSGNVSSDTGTITLRNNADGSGTATNVSNWSEAIIFGHHRGDNTASGTNDALADNWPVMDPGSNNQRIDWSFDANHDSNGTNRHFVHVLNNADLNVVRYQNTSNTAGESTINISTAGLSNLNQSLIIGSSRTSGGGQAYARGWRNYYLNSTTEAAHWAHRSGNTMAHEIQIVDLSALNTASCTTTVSTFPYSEGFESGLGAWEQGTNDDNDWIRESGPTLSGNTGPNGAQEGSWYMYTESSNPNFNQDFDLESPCFDLSSVGAAQFSFYYHMYGADMGTLNVDISTDSGATYPTNLWSQTGQVQTSSGDAWSLASIDLSSYIGQTIKLRFRGTTGSNYRGDMSIDDISLTTTTPNPEINLVGNAQSIIDGDTTPNVADDTDFGSVGIGVPSPHTFTIENNGAVTLNLTGSSPYVTISGANAGDFAVTSTPSNTITGSSSTTFEITFTPSATGLRTATLTIANDDSDENPYNFNIQGNGIILAPEIDIQGNTVSIADGDTTPSLTDDTDFGNVATGGSNANTFTIENTGTAGLNLTGAAPYVTISGAHAADFTVTATPANSIGAGSNTTFEITFSPSAIGLRTATVSIANNDSDETPYNFNIQGTGTLATYSNVSVSVNWPAYSGENRVEVYTPSGVLLTTIDDGYDGSAGSYSTSVNLGCLEDLNNYYIIMYDSVGDGWDGVANVTVTSGGATVLTNNGAGTNATGTTAFFNVSGGGASEIDITGNGVSIADGDTTPDVADDTDFGTIDISAGAVVRTFTIHNNGCSNLNLTGASPYVTISGSADFTLTAIPNASVVSSGSTTFQISFDPSLTGVVTATVSIANDDADENPYNFNIQGEGITGPPQYTAHYESFDINDGGWTAITSTNDNWIWTNSYPASINELADGSFWRNNNFDDYNNNTNIVIESPQFDFTGLQNLQVSLDVKYKIEDNQDGMIIQYSVAGGAYTTLGTSGSGTNWYEDAAAAIGSDAWNGDGHTATPAFDPHNQFTNARFTLSDAIFSNQNNVRFRIQFTSDGSGVDDGVAFDNFRIEADPTTALSNPTEAPADVANNLRLWLKLNEGVTVADGNPLTGIEDQAFANSLDKEDAYQATSLAPTYRDNATRNINFNPVADFDHNNVEYLNGKGGFYSQDYFVVVKCDDIVDTQTGSFSPGRQFAIGARYGDDAFHEDPTGLGLGSTSARYTDEIISHNLNSFPSTATTPNDDSYGMAYTSNTDSFDNEVLILNVKSNAARTSVEIYKNGKRIDNMVATLPSNGTPLNFKEFNNLPFILGAGRSGISGRTTSQLNGMLSEVISYSAPNSSLNKQKIQSYLGLKYGVTLQDDASALADYRLNDVDYIDSNGTTIWDTSANNGYNYDVAGIGRDDDSFLLQKQSKSQNNEADGTGATSGLLTIGLSDLYDTNNENIGLNSDTFTDRAFLIWGNNNADLDLAATTITVNMSAGISPPLVSNVTFTGMQRVWKVVETGGDVGRVKLSIPQNAIRNITPPGNYLMFISDTNVFDPTADYTIMTSDGNGNLETEYDFDGTKYITFGYAPEVELVRSVYFDGTLDYVDIGDALNLNNSEFTVSAWVKRSAASTNVSIVSKRDAAYTDGYDFKIDATGRFEMSWKNGSTQTITSDIVIPVDEWHHVAVIYNGTDADLYVDGVLDKKEALTPPTPTTHSFFIAAAGKNAPTAHFEGNIDEVRVWDIALTLDQMRYIMNQEIIENGGFVGGAIIPNTISNNEVASIPWSALAAYYPMSTYTYTNTNDESGNNHTGALRNLDTVDKQTAPIPYESRANGSWSSNATWLNNSVQPLPNSLSIVDNTTPVDWNIVRTSHDINIATNTTLGREREVLGLMVDSGDIQLNGDTATNTGNGLTISHYLKLDGTIDLEGESQLIQALGSDFDVTSSGTLERDQQGTADVHTYNYWSSPVGLSNTTTNNNSYTLPDVMRDGTSAINFITSGYDGTNTNPIGIADYWIWKFANQLDDDYSSWQHVRSTGTIFAGEGFTMKGPGTGAIIDDQNYVFIGKPNNGDINLTINGGNDYLVGNPYPSAIDGRQFILDNGSVIGGTGATTGTLYFWEHWGGGSHNLADYQGGYATYNLSGGAPSASQGTNDPDVGTGGIPTKTPGRYIPVNQGFFVVAEGAGGTINFNNGQRIFQKEGASSVFLAPDLTDQTTTNNRNALNSDVDLRTKMRFGFNSVNTIRRQLLLTVDVNATPDVDWGYDAKNNETQMDDMLWLLEDETYIIQGTDAVNETTVLPLSIKVDADGTNSITIDELNYVPETLGIYVRDTEMNIYHDLRVSDYEFYLSTGTYNERFAIVFSPGETLGVDTNDISALDVHFSNASESIVLVNPTFKDINNIEMFNVLGQSIYKTTTVPAEHLSEFKVRNLSTGTYIIKVHTDQGTLSKKVLVE